MAHRLTTDCASEACGHARARGPREAGAPGSGWPPGYLLRYPGGHRVHRSPRRVTVAPRRGVSVCHRPRSYVGGGTQAAFSRNPCASRGSSVTRVRHQPTRAPQGPPIAPCRCIHPEASRGSGQPPRRGSRPISRISPLCARAVRPRRLGRRGPGAGARRDRAGRDERRGSRRRAPRRCRSGRTGRPRRAERASVR